VRQERNRSAGVGEETCERDDRHHRFGADHRHEHERHQRAGAVTSHAAEHGRKQRNARDQQDLVDRNIGEGGDQGDAPGKPPLLSDWPRAVEREKLHESSVAMQ
jgi:hypothetical protein